MAGYRAGRPPFNRNTDAMLAAELKRHISSYVNPPTEAEQTFHNEYVRTIAYTIMDNRGSSYNQNEFMKAAGATVDYAGEPLVDLYACRVRYLETADDLTTSDAQAIADGESERKLKAWWGCLDYRTRQELKELTA